MIREIGVILGVIVALGVVNARVLDGMWMARLEDEFVNTSVVGEAVTGGGGQVLRHDGGERDSVSDRHNYDCEEFDKDSEQGCVGEVKGMVGRKP